MVQITIIAVGNKMPAWVSECCKEYLQRMPAEYKIKIIEVAAEKRGKSQSMQVARQRETQRLLAAAPANDWLIVLDEKGQSLSTIKLANKFEQWSLQGKNLSFLLGGADGFDYSIARKGAASWPDWRWSLSPLTYPHPLARVIVAEQLYRVWSVSVGHPYHRE